MPNWLFTPEYLTLKITTGVKLVVHPSLLYTKCDNRFQNDCELSELHWHTFTAGFTIMSVSEYFTLTDSYSWFYSHLCLWVFHADSYSWFYSHLCPTVFHTDWQLQQVLQSPLSQSISHWQLQLVLQSPLPQSISHWLTATAGFTVTSVPEYFTLTDSNSWLHGESVSNRSIAEAQVKIQMTSLVSQQT